MVAVTLPVASADEAKAECEPDQQWIGYRTSDAIRAFVQSQVGQLINPCEGEHWDGQDSVQPGQDPGSTTGCNKAQSSTSGGLFLGSCMSPDPNSNGADPLTGSAQPVTFRVSYKSVSPTTQEVFVGIDIALVGRASTYQGLCRGGAGLEGDSTCDSNTAQTRSGTYLRDNTPGNILATVVSAAGITRGHPSEADCSHATYVTGANNGDRTLCGRDNTAITVQTLLP